MLYPTRVLTNRIARIRRAYQADLPDTVPLGPVQRGLLFSGFTMLAVLLTLQLLDGLGVIHIQ